MNKRISLGLLALTGISQSLMADEGQWQPHQIAQLQSEFNRVGIQLPAKQVADLNSYPMNAVVGLGYCSASFVSAKGLVVTNHHCAYGAIQNNTTIEKDRIKDGYLARSMDQELNAGPQERLYITEQVTDVTNKVTGSLNDKLTGKARFDAIQINRKALIKACESSPDYRCSVRAFHHGMEYFLLKQLMLKDVRLVYAPPLSVGNYGGDIDNYEYPRHTGDFTFFRAYVGKDGKPAAYSKDNVPYQPKSYLKINASGVRNGDGVILAGYPGRTSRYKLASEIQFAADWEYPAQIKVYNTMLDVIASATKDNPSAAVKYSSTTKSINNRMKKRQGLLAGFKVTDIYGIKQNNEQALLEWIKQDKARAGYARTHQKLGNMLQKSQAASKRDFYYGFAQQPALLGAAARLYKLAKESEKPDAQRKQGFQQRDLLMFKARMKRMQRQFDVAVDRKLWAHNLFEYMQQPSNTRVMAFDKALNLPKQANVEQLHAHIKPYYDASRLADETTRLSWIGQSPAQFEKSNDPFIKLAVKMYQTNKSFEAEREELSGQMAQVRPDYMKAIIAYNKSLNKPVYPDANGTLRISYGTVSGYPAQDGQYKTPFTSVKGMLAKDTGIEPFDAPMKIKTAYADQRFGSYRQVTLDAKQDNGLFCGMYNCGQSQAEPFNDVPVNFLSSTDTTGGNSGSPVMNGKGELVGLNFDSTFESITKDWYFNAGITRAIHVDIRYVLWILEQVEQADNLIDEMDIVR